MDLSFSMEQQVLREEVRRYCEEQFQRKNAPQGGFSFNRGNWEMFANLGWLGVLLPEELGGSNGSIIDACIILEELGRNLVIEPYLPCAILATRAIHNATNDELRTSLLTQMLKGDLVVALAHTESGARGNTAIVETVAERTSSGDYVLRGKKAVVLAGSIADQFAVSARLVGSGSKNEGIALFMVNKDAPGVRRRDYCLIDGRPAADLTLKDVKVTPESLLISEDDGLKAIEDATDFAIAGQCAEAVGGMDKVVKTTAEYLKTRRAYGTTLNKFQALQHRMADMFIELELSRSMLYCIFAAFSEPTQRKRSALVSSAKALIDNSAKFVAGNGIQLHGAQGMADDYVIGQHFKQLAVLQGLFGNSNFHWEQCASYLKDGLLQSFDAQSSIEAAKPASAPQRQFIGTAEPAVAAVSG